MGLSCSDRYVGGREEEGTTTAGWPGEEFSDAVLFTSCQKTGPYVEGLAGSLMTGESIND